MTEEKNVAASRFENPPLCKCGELAVIYSNSDVPEFRCRRKKAEVSNPMFCLNHCFAVFTSTTNY